MKAQKANFDMNRGWDSLAAETLYAYVDQCPENELSFYERRMIANGGRALDLACGTGRHLFKLAEQGLEVDGMDASADALRFAQMKADQTKVRARFYHQRMEELDLPKQYSTIYITDGSFMAIYDRMDALIALTRFRNHLNPGGELLVELSIPEEVRETNRNKESVKKPLA